MKCLKNKKGFTLVELIVVIAILGVLAAITIPASKSIIDNQEKSAAKNISQQIFRITVSNISELKHNGNRVADADYLIVLAAAVDRDVTSSAVDVLYYYDDSNTNLTSSQNIDYVLLTMVGTTVTTTYYNYEKSGAVAYDGMSYSQIVRE